MKTLGILGGMGPLAGAYFYRRVIENTRADCDGRHLPVFLVGNPAIPDRTAHLLGYGPDPFPSLLEGVLTMVGLGAEVVAIPCNTAHAYLERLSERIPVPILDMPGLAARAAARRGRGPIGLLSTRGTLSARVYHRAADEEGIGLLCLPSGEAERLEARIYAQKGGAPTAGNAYMPYVEELLTAGAEAVILGCTEISAAFAGSAPASCIDALEVLAQESVRLCGDREEVDPIDLRRAFVG